MPAIEDQSEDEIAEFLILYLQYRRVQKWGWCSYKVFAATISLCDWCERQSRPPFAMVYVSAKQWVVR